MADKSEPPECVKDGWWQGGCFCLDKVGVLCSTAVQRIQGICQTDIVGWQAATFPYHPFLPPSLPLLLIPLSHNIFIFLSSSLSLFSVYLFPSLFLFLNFFSLPMSFYAWVCVSFLSVSLWLHSVPVFFFPSLFFCFPHASSPSIHLLCSISATWSTVTGQPPGSAQGVDKREAMAPPPPLWDSRSHGRGN